MKKSLFNFTHFGRVQLIIGLKNNVVYNSEAIEASNLFEIDEEKFELAKLRKFSDIDKVIRSLISFKS